MYIVSVEKLNTKKSKVRFENEVECVCYRSEIRKFGLEAESELSDESYQELMKDYILRRAKKKAMDLLIRSDKTEKELRSKLQRDGFPEHIIEQTIAFLHSYHYINEENHLESYIRYHAKGKSKIYLKQELKRKGFESEKITEYLEEYYDEYQELEGLLRKKMAGKREYTKEQRDKLFGQLYRKGFSPSDIKRCFDRLCEYDSKDTI